MDDIAFDIANGNGSHIAGAGAGSGNGNAGFGSTNVDENGFSQSLLTFAAIMTFLIMVVGICGNFLTVVALLKCPKVRNVAAAFIISLCIADLLFCVFVLPFQGLRFVQGTWKHGPVLCRLIPFIQYGNIGVSLLCIAMITINRYVMIAHHSCYAKIYRRHWIAIMIAACWLFSYGMQLPTLLGAWGRFGYDERLQTCSIMSDKQGHSSKTTLFITAFVIPCLVIIACYAKIFWVVHKSEQRLKRHANKQNSIPNNLRPVLPPVATTASNGNVNDSSLPASASAPAPAPDAMAKTNAARPSSDSSSYSTDVNETKLAAGKQPTTRVKDQREVRTKRNEWRITKMVLAIFLSFVICYLPITIVKVADKDVEHPSLHIFSYIMLYLSACINPIIYVIMNKQYRKAYKTVVLCEPSRLLLPFGKTNGASSAAEKWKDTGLSNNHSRTLVSQMSAHAVASVSTANSPSPVPSPKQSGPAPIVLELMSRASEQAQSKSNVPMSVGTLSPPPPSVMTAGSAGNSSSVRLALKKNNHSYINNGFNSNIFRTPSGTGPAMQASPGMTPIRRITMVGDDIILEEEELSTPSPTETQAAPPTPIYVNIDSAKAKLFYNKSPQESHVMEAAIAAPAITAASAEAAVQFDNQKD